MNSTNNNDECDQSDQIITFKERISGVSEIS